MSRCHNFNAGPSVLPESVLLKAQEELLNYNGEGMSVLEMSHRSATFESIIETAEADLRSLMGIPDNYKVLFLQGGASMQFAMLPQNLCLPGKPVDVLLTGSWTKKAVKEINKIGKANILASSEDAKFSYIPKVDASAYSSDASYAFVTSNNTIAGTQIHDFPDTGDVPLVADMSSDILSRPLDVSQFGVIFAGAQKNMGPAGVTIVIIREDLIERADESLPTILQYRSHAANNSMYNTCPTFSIYMVGLVLKWLKSLGGLSEIQKINERKAGKLYEAIDTLDGYYCPVKEDSRSLMNVVFRVAGDDEEAEKRFVSEAKAKGIVGIKGHRSVGGLRASIYNALPEASIDALIDFMKQFR